MMKYKTHDLPYSMPYVRNECRVFTIRLCPNFERHVLLPVMERIVGAVQTSLLNVNPRRFISPSFEEHVT